MNRPRTVTLITILVAVIAVVLGNQLVDNLEKAGHMVAAVAALLVGLPAGLAAGKMQKLSGRAAFVSLGVAVVVYILVLWRWNSMTDDKVEVIQATFFYLPLLVIVLGAFILYFSSRGPSGSGRRNAD